jgi:haloacetate dehalogenase
MLVDAGFTVVCPDLRGYGKSTAPAPRPDHSQASKREMAADVAEVMSRLGQQRYAVVGHDRGSFAQPSKPERAILSDPDAWYSTGAGRESQMGSENYADYHSAIHDPAVVVAMLEDYRAGLGPDRVADDNDRVHGRRIECPTLVAWSAHDDLRDLYGNVLEIWKPWAADARGREIGSGHHLAEDNPTAVAAAIIEHCWLPSSFPPPVQNG